MSSFSNEPSASPTSCASLYSCAVDPSLGIGEVFQERVQIFVDVTPLSSSPDPITRDELNLLLWNYSGLAYDPLVGTFCDPCSRRVQLDTITWPGDETAPESTELVFAVSQTGGCSSMFDSNIFGGMLSPDDVLAFEATCGSFFDEFTNECCCTCSPAFGGISVQDFARQLQMEIGVTIINMFSLGTETPTPAPAPTPATGYLEYDVYVFGTDPIFLAGRFDVDIPPLSSSWTNGLFRVPNPPDNTLETFPLSVPIQEGQRLHLAEPASGGGVNLSPGLGPPYLTANGATDTIISLTGLDGISGYIGPRGALVGVFLDDSIPNNPALAPAALDFSPTGNVGTDFVLLEPEIGQVFFIGDGYYLGQAREFIAPLGTTRAFFGIPDIYTDATSVVPPGGYNDNDGDYYARVFVDSQNDASTWPSASFSIPPSIVPTPAFPFPTPSPTVCVDWVGCSIDQSASFNANVLVQFSQNVQNIVSVGRVNEFLIAFELSYQNVTGAVCDPCHRRIADLEIISPSFLASSNRQLQEDDVVLGDYLIVQVTLSQDQLGGCDRAFDNGDDVLALSDTAAYADACQGMPFGEYGGGCCCFCSAPTGGVSRLDFREQLQFELGQPVLDILEVETPDNDQQLCSDDGPEESVVEISIGLDYVLAPENVTSFFGTFISTYNRLCLENCFPQSITDIELDDVVLSTNRRRSECRGRTSCLNSFVRVSCNARECPEDDDLDRLFRGRGGTRKLSKVDAAGTSANLEMAIPRNLQVGASLLSEECICAVGNGLPEPTNDLPTLDEFVESFNKDLNFVGIPAIESVNDAEPTVSPTRSPVMPSFKGKGKGNIFMVKGFYVRKSRYRGNYKRSHKNREQTKGDSNFKSKGLGVIRVRGHQGHPNQIPTPKASPRARKYKRPYYWRPKNYYKRTKKNKKKQHEHKRQKKRHPANVFARSPQRPRVSRHRRPPTTGV